MPSGPSPGPPTRRSKTTDDRPNCAYFDSLNHWPVSLIGGTGKTADAVQSFASITSDCTASFQSAGKVGASSIARCSGAIADRIARLPRSPGTSTSQPRRLSTDRDIPFFDQRRQPRRDTRFLEAGDEVRLPAVPRRVGERLEISSGKLGEPGVPQVVRSVGQPGILFSLLGNCPGQRSGENSEMYFEQVRRHPSIAQNRSEPGNLAADLLRFVLTQVSQPGAIALGEALPPLAISPGVIGEDSIGDGAGAKAASISRGSSGIGTWPASWFKGLRLVMTSAP